MPSVISIFAMVVLRDEFCADAVGDVRKVNEESGCLRGCLCLRGSVVLLLLGEPSGSSECNVIN